jgi:hypothetical protein
MSEVRVNKLSPRSGTTVTLGDSGDTISIPSGVTLSTTSFSSTGIDDNATSTAITIDSSDNVGIGTSSPDRLLHVKSAGNTRAKIEAGTASGFGQLYLGTENSWIIGYGSTHSVFPESLSLKNLNASGTIRFFNSGDYERMRIDSSGNVGIGTSSPSSVLDVSGGLTVDGNDNTIEHNITRQTGTTNTSRPVIKLTAKNTASDVTDNFGSAIQFRMKDNTADTELGAIGFLRDGADGSGKFVVGQDSQLLSSSPQFIVKSSGNVGIGTSSPDSKVNIEATKTTALSTANDFLTTGLTIDDTTAYNTSGGVGGGITFRGKRNSSGIQTVYGAIVGTKNGTTNDEYNGNLRFFTNNNTNGIPTEHMRINRLGYVGIGTTSPAHAIELWGDGGNTIFAIRDTDGSPTFSNRYIKFQDGSGTEIGKILRQGSAVAYSTSSDYRLKENVVEMTNATDRLKQLQPKRFNFIGYNNVFDGFLAHEVSDIVPEAISGEKDAVQVWQERDELPEGVSVGDNKLDENGNTIPDYQGIDQSKLVPLLVKTIQELEARITTLENA